MTSVLIALLQPEEQGIFKMRSPVPGPVMVPGTGIDVLQEADATVVSLLRPSLPSLYFDTVSVTFSTVRSLISEATVDA